MQVVLGTRLAPPSALPSDSLFIQVVGPDRVLWRNGRIAYLHPRQADLVTSLLVGCSSSSELISVLWGADPEGGPVWALAALRSIIWRTRAALEPLDLSITFNGLGYILEPS